ncbi:MAG: 4-coumarate--CoA ligase [Bacillariaceae sp.]|jgi:4-coumarate--CoA ligase
MITRSILTAYNNCCFRRIIYDRGINKKNKNTILRSISSTSVIRNGGGELAERCNENVVSSPFPSFPEKSWDVPCPDFIMSNWKKHGGINENATTTTTTTTESGVDNGQHLLSDELAIFDGSTGMKRTFTDHYNSTRGIAGSLKYDLGVDENSCVCLFAPNHVDYVPVTLAVGLCGAKLTPVNPQYKENELSNVLDRSRSTVLITHKHNVDIAVKAAANSKYVKHVLVMTEDGEAAQDGLDNLESIKTHNQGFDKTTDCFQCQTNTHPYLLPYSSGTTGKPKGVAISHANLTVNLLQLHEVERVGFRDGVFSPLPFFHIYGMVVSAMYSSWIGNPIYTMSGRFDFELMLEMIQKYQPKNAHLVPPIILGLAKSPLVDKYDMSSLETIISAAAPLGADTEIAVRDRLQCNVKQAWGMSELSPIGTITPSTKIKPGSVGLMVSNTYGKILDKNGKSLEPNQQGELAIKGPQVMMGYQDEIQQTKDCLSSSGWLRTGDMFYYDEDGYFFMTDRIKELIKTRGFQVAPAELEELILGHDDVNDVAVIQIPDEASGELPRAYIVLKEKEEEKEGSADHDDDNEQHEEKLKKDIYEWVKERVAPYKRLDGGIVFVDSIPKSASGKILRRILRDELAEQMKASK